MEKRLGTHQSTFIDQAGKLCLLSLVLLAFSGCGTTKSYTATEQLLMSDAVDATVAKLDFSPLQGQMVYLDSSYLKTVKNHVLVDSDYVISALRQQMMGDGVLLVDNRDEADVIAEARMGALGLDGHNVVYGIPSNNALSAASAAVEGVPLVPSLPEISFARREAKSGAAKVAVFAYDRESKEPLWQSGLAQSTSTARDTWVLGVGPFQAGTIYNETRFAGDSVIKSLNRSHDDSIRHTEQFAEYSRSRLFDLPGEDALPIAEAAEGNVADAGATDDGSLTDRTMTAGNISDLPRTAHR